MDAILHAEVCYGRTLVVWLYIHILTEQRINIINALHQFLILYNLFFTAKTQALQKCYGIVLHGAVEFWIEVTEQVTSLVVPYPPHVVSEFFELTEFGWNTAFNDDWLPAGLICITCFNLHILYIGYLIVLSFAFRSAKS